jgi:phosphatidate cytidylyltransferase
MITRIITGIIAASIWFTMLLKGTYHLFWIVMTIIGIICAYEYFSMVLQKTNKKFIPLATISCIIPLVFIYQPDLAHLNAGVVTGTLSLFAILLYNYQSIENPFDLSLRFIFGLIYCGFLTGHIILILALEHGPYWLFSLTVITTFSDSGAYFTGKTLGKHKLCPHISPGKTVEGFAGGLVSAGLGGVLITNILLPEVNPVHITLWAILLSLLGVAGDLSESIIKRATNTKDSGHILPGHGGMLDRIDSLLFCGPVFYYILYFNLL